MEKEFNRQKGVCVYVCKIGELQIPVRGKSICKCMEA